MLRLIVLGICIVSHLSTQDIGAATLNPTSLGLEPMRYGAQAWAPVGTFGTASGNSILAISGMNSSGELKTTVYWIETSGGTPSVVATNSTDIPGMVFGQLDWADYDRDGDMDLAIAGRMDTVVDFGSSAIVAVYRQDNGHTFTAETNLPSFAPVDSAALQWVDYDVDGYIDLFVTGRTRIVDGETGTVRGEDRTYMLRNNWTGIIHEFELDNGVVSRVDQISPTHGGDIEWADMDGDGDPDLAITGQSLTQLQGNRYIRDVLTDVYINEPPGVLTRNLLTELPVRHDGGVSWGDFDRDGDMDLAYSGYMKSEDGGFLTLEVFDNIDLGFFSDAPIQLGNEKAVAGPLQWGDVDNDGWLDLVAMGDSSSGSGGIRYYSNLQNGTFSLTTMAGLPASLVEGSMGLGHLDDDGTLDLIATGNNGGSIEAYSWTTSGFAPNTAPTEPSIPRDRRPKVTNDLVIFSWEAATDAESAELVSYELMMHDGTKRLFTGPANFVRGPHGTGQTFKMYRTMRPSSGLSLRIRAIDASGMSSLWSEEILIHVQDFVSSQENVVPLERATATWVDVDNDGQADLVVNGRDQGQRITSRLYLNDSGKLVPNTAFNLPGVEFAGQAWGDVDGDGYMDVLLTGSSSAGARIARLYRNASSTSPGLFRSGAFNFRELTGSRAAMGDIDNDGDIDIIMTGLTVTTTFSLQVALNTGTLDGQEAKFDTTSLNLRPLEKDQGAIDGWVSLYDIDQDGDLDITLQGATREGQTAEGEFTFPNYGGILEVYRNNGNLQFSSIYDWPEARDGTVTLSMASGDTRLDQVDVGEHAWVDIDSDGDPDFIVVGWSNVTVDGSVLRIYENTGGGTLVLKDSHPAMWSASLAAADVDNDGAVDIVISGFNDLLGDRPTVRFYKNNTSGSFTLQSIDVLDDNGAGAGSVRLSDMEGDGDLDAVLVGHSVTSGGNEVPLSTIFSNTNAALFTNNPPDTPDTLWSYEGTTDRIDLSWTQSGDDMPFSDHQTYALRVGTSSGMGDVRPGVEIVGPGGMGMVDSAWIKGLPDGHYYWSVQAVDNSLIRSDWAPDSIFTIDTTPPRVARVVGDGLSRTSSSLVFSIDFADSLTGVFTDTSAGSGVEVVVKAANSAPRPAKVLSWSAGGEWTGQVDIPASMFFSEPATISIAGVSDIRGNVMSDTTFTTRIDFTTTGVTVTKTQGGVVSNAAKTIELYFPPYAVRKDVGIALFEPDIDTLPPAPKDAEFVGLPAHFEPDDDSLDRLDASAVLTLYYCQGDVLSGIVNEDSLRIYKVVDRIVPSTAGSATVDTIKVWEYIGGSAEAPSIVDSIMVDPNIISAPIWTLGTYGLFEAQDDTVEAETLVDLTCTPRVFSPGVFNNPEAFSGRTVVSFTVASDDAGRNAKVQIYNAAGRFMRKLPDHIAVPGANAINWDGNDDEEHVVPSGLYIVVAEVGDKKNTHTVVVLNKYALEPK